MPLCFLVPVFTITPLFSHLLTPELLQQREQTGAATSKGAAMARWPETTQFVEVVGVPTPLPGPSWNHGTSTHP